MLEGKPILISPTIRFQAVDHPMLTFSKRGQLQAIKNQKANYAQRVGNFILLLWDFNAVVNFVSQCMYACIWYLYHAAKLLCAATQTFTNLIPSKGLQKSTPKISKPFYVGRSKHLIPHTSCHTFITWHFNNACSLYSFSVDCPLFGSTVCPEKSTYTDISNRVSQ